ncbi:MAG: hypothetical protein JSW38_11920 [Dehalococcoidia bacterium]|nr:MAG: hypothetical protein JSV02_04720 [Dehalococcoidia bacterium]UCG82870.1 MAG: hypothetical protein JSW38_11920 [Dehalococcoidia bacterium]
MSTKQKAKGKRSEIRSCDKCVHKSICIIYHGHGQLELRFGNSYSKDPDGFVSKLDERLAYKCLNYLENVGDPEP